MRNTKEITFPNQKINCPSILQIISNDQFTIIMGISLPVILGLIYIAMNIFGFSFTSERSGTTVSGDGSWSQLLIPIVATIIGLLIVVLRVNHFNSTFKNGVVVIGEIMHISLQEDRGTISYTYIWNGDIFEGFNDIVKNSKTISFKKGDKIPIIVNSKRANKSLIKDLFYKD